MAVVQATTTIRSLVNQGAQGLFNALSWWISANPSVNLIDVDLARPESQFDADEHRLRIVYETGKALSGGWQPKFYRSGPTGSAQQQMTNDLGLGATFVPWFLIDATRHVPGRASADTLIVLGVNTVWNPFAFNGKNIYIAAPVADIGIGAAGSCSLYDGSGALLGTNLVTNVGTSVWLANQRDYAIVDEDSGLMIGLPTCDPSAAAFTPPAATTTTAYPCPSYFPQTLPNTQTITTSTTTSAF